MKKQSLYIFYSDEKMRTCFKLAGITFGSLFTLSNDNVMKLKTLRI